MPVAGNGHPGRRVQYAALPYRVRRDGEVQLRLITSRETRRWVIPKGWPIKGLSPAKTAAREAYEEAGLMGSIAREAIGIYTYEKKIGIRSVLCDVMVFPLKVKRHLQKWPERAQRYGFWFSIDTAAAAVQEEDLKALILAFGDYMAARLAAKRMAEASGAPPPAAAGKKKADAKHAKPKDDAASPAEATLPLLAGPEMDGHAGDTAPPVVEAAPRRGKSTRKRASKALSGDRAGRAEKEAGKKSAKASSKGAATNVASRERASATPDVTGKPVVKAKASGIKAARIKAGAGKAEGKAPAERDAPADPQMAGKPSTPPVAKPAAPPVAKPAVRPVAKASLPKAPLPKAASPKPATSKTLVKVRKGAPVRSGAGPSAGAQAPASADAPLASRTRKLSKKPVKGSKKTASPAKPVLPAAAAPPPRRPPDKA
ncbi:NUDIX domain-containing protein [Xanthobacter sediminis]